VKRHYRTVLWIAIVLGLPAALFSVGVLLPKFFAVESKIADPVEETQSARRDACREVILKYCVASQSCSGVPYEDCFRLSMENDVCNFEIQSTLADIAVCSTDIDGAPCGSASSCIGLH
jgi:hypothetical protein